MFPRTRQLIELDPHRCHGIQILHNPFAMSAGTSRVESPLIGARIKALREQRELTQDSVARLFGSEALSQGVPVYDLAHTQNVGRRGLHRQFTQLTEEIKRRVDSI